MTPGLWALAVAAYIVATVFTAASAAQTAAARARRAPQPPPIAPPDTGADLQARPREESS